MEGITFLNEFATTGEVLAPWFGIGTSAFIVGFIGLLVCLTMSKPFSPLFVILTIFFGVSTIFGLSIGTFAPREQKTNYQVLIDDSVNLNEFMENYKIVDQDGLIYTIVERVE